MPLQVGKGAINMSRKLRKKVSISYDGNEKPEEGRPDILEVNISRLLSSAYEVVEPSPAFTEQLLRQLVAKVERRQRRRIKVVGFLLRFGQVVIILISKVRLIMLRGFSHLQTGDHP